MRLFIAIKFPAAAEESLVKLVDTLSAQFPQISWTKKENLHLTLKFLGYFDEQKNKNQVTLEKIKNSVGESIKGLPKFTLEFDKVGYFSGEQLIIWMGFKSDDQLLYIVNNLDRGMGKLGFPTEKRIYTPHMTIGRGKRLDKVTLENIKRMIDQGNFTIAKPFPVSAITLINSDLTATGPIYTPLFTFALS